MPEQHIAGGLDRRTVDVRADEERAALYPLLPPRGFVLFEPGVFERPRNIAGNMPGSFSKRRSERTVGDDRPHAGDHNGHSCGEMGRELA